MQLGGERMTNDKGDLGTIAYVAIVAILVILVAVCICIPLFTQDTTTLTVVKTDSYTSTDCDTDSNGHSSCSTTLHNLAYTDGEILQFNDCFVLWVWGSQTIYSHIETGKTYTFKVYGFNVPWLNMYRSVISYTAV
jgi:hypothetical protein